MRHTFPVCLLAALVLISRVQGDDGSTAKAPASVRNAEQTFQRATEKAQAEMEQKEKPLQRDRTAKFAAARKAYLTAIDTAVKDALKSGDLATANKLNAVRKGVADAGEAESGGGNSKSASGSRTFLCSLEHFDVLVFDNWFGKCGMCRTDAKITVDGKYSPNGLCLVPPERGYSKVQFHLDGKYSKFVSGTALNDSCDGNDQGHVAFEVLGDGKSLWKGAPIEKWKTIYDCAVDVRGVKTLELRVNCPGPNGYQQAVWIEPQLLR